MAEKDGIPTVAATADGIDASQHPNPYFYLDFSSSKTILWGVDCTHSAMGSYTEGSCNNPPTLMQNYFDGSELPTSPLSTDFTDQQFGGYTVSGKQYLGEICFGTNCQVMNLYSGDSVTANDWNWNQDGAYGIIGLGGASGLWEGFIQPGTYTATYSIGLARFSNPLSAEMDLKDSSTITSNITLGSANAD